MHTGSTLPLAPFSSQTSFFFLKKKEFPLVFPDTVHKRNSGVIVPGFPGPAQGQKLGGADFKSLGVALGSTKEGYFSKRKAQMGRRDLPRVSKCPPPPSLSHGESGVNSVILRSKGEARTLT